MLGIADSNGFKGQPGWYFDNQGGFDVSYRAGKGFAYSTASDNAYLTQSEASELAEALWFTKTGSGRLVLDHATTFSGPTTVVGGTIAIANPAGLSQSSVAVLETATLRVLGTTSATVAGLSLSGDGILDVTSGAMTVATGLSPERAKAELLKGRGDGSWNGASGITSTFAAAEIQNGIVRSVGWKENTDGSVTIAYAAPGDTDLSGDVNVFDLVGINGSGSYGKGTPSVWSQGDFDYNGVTNIFDMVLTNGAGVYGRGSYLPAAPASASVNAVPEPSACFLALFGLAGGYWSMRRRGA